MLIAAALAFWNQDAALGFVIFMLCFWIFVGAISLILWATRNLLPQSISDEHKAEIRQLVGGTLFLGGSALIGMVLRGDNAVSQFVARKVPEGFSIGFIDPTFAVLCIVGIWIYTAYRLRK
ncbi:MAG: hypothetical protein V4753_07070 [Pseudomonadota bacterium]